MDRVCGFDHRNRKERERKRGEVGLMNSAIRVSRWIQFSCDDAAAAFIYVYIYICISCNVNAYEDEDGGVDALQRARLIPPLDDDVFL